MFKTRVLAMILAGGRVGELSVLTLKRPKSAMPFGGLFRVIDCALTNLTESGIENIGILSQYRPVSLMDHVGSGHSWDLCGSCRGIRFLPPHTGSKDGDWYKGTADAIYQNITYIQDYNPEEVLIVSGDHIYRMDYGPLFDLHRSRNADVTIAVTPVKNATGSRFGFVRMNEDGRVTEYVEKPKKHVSNLASMTVYLFKTAVLYEVLRRNAQCGKTFQIYDEVLPGLAEQGWMYAHVFDEYWAYSRTIVDYYSANMDCLPEGGSIDLSEWQLRTKLFGSSFGDYPPVLFGEHSCVSNSVIAPGCVIHGKVYNSVISPEVVVEEGAKIHDSIILQGSKVKSGAKIHRTITDKFCEIGRGVQIGKPECATIPPNRKFPELLACGITVIGRKSTIADGVRIGGNVIVCPESDIGCDVGEISDGALFGKGLGGN